MEVALQALFLRNPKSETRMFEGAKVAKRLSAGPSSMQGYLTPAGGKVRNHTPLGPSETRVRVLDFMDGDSGWILAESCEMLDES